MSRWEHCPTILRACMNCKLPGALADSILKEALVAAFLLTSNHFMKPLKERIIQLECS